jgi:hypothetical protein
MATLSETVEQTVVEQAIMGKKWYKSKTLWANAIATAGVGLQMKFGFIIPPEYQTFILSAVNAWLRKVTKEEITW